MSAQYSGQEETAGYTALEYVSAGDPLADSSHIYMA